MKTDTFIVAVVGVLIGVRGAVADSWLCTDEASQRKGNAILACGIGVGSDENVARLTAFDAAKAEFVKLCSASDDCKRRIITVQPHRTACEQNAEKGYKCYRLIEFDIGAEPSLKQSSQATDAKLIDRPDSFQSFSYDQIDKLPKLRVGMPKRELLADFGAPQSVSNSTNFGSGKSYQQLFYSGKMCVYENSSCYVIVEDGQVTGWEEFKPVYTDDLK